jgi:hypothetical protein
LFKISLIQINKKFKNNVELISREKVKSLYCVLNRGKTEVDHQHILCYGLWVHSQQKISNNIMPRYDDTP